MLIRGSTHREVPITTDDYGVVSEQLRDSTKGGCAYLKAAATLTRRIGFLVTLGFAGSGSSSSSDDFPAAMPSSLISIHVSGDSLRLRLLLAGVGVRERPRLPVRVALRPRDGDLDLYLWYDG